MENIENSDEKMNKIIKVIKESYHPTAEELGNYILYKNGIDLIDKSIIKLAPKIEAHLRKCSECNSMFLELDNEYRDLDNFLKENEIDQIVRKSKTITLSQKHNQYRYTGFALLFIFIIYLGAFSISKVITPSSIKYASLENRSDIYETRGRATYDFQESLKALENKDNESAVIWLNKDIVNNKADETIFYSYYVMGLAYLEAAHKNILGLFPSYDKIKVGNGITALNNALEKNRSGKFPNINLDIYYFLGKANLMVNNTNDAKDYLIKVVNEKGSYMNEAKNILNELE